MKKVNTTEKMKPPKPTKKVFKMKKKELTPKLIWWGWKTA
ncbi:hypothetical protein MTsPCn5_22330 [Croceitalea sp. MTPC5]|nr:hypothetical protein MTsPCn5_22330 [Croceitalea sp. MTPC5]